MKQDEFLKKIEAALSMRIGNIIAGSILKSNLLKLNKAVESMNRNDMQILVENITKSVQVFASKDESKLINEDLKELVKRLD